MGHFNKCKLAILLLALFPFPYFAFGQTNTSICSTNGYTVLTVNGINTSETNARNSKRALEDKLSTGEYNNEPLTVDFLYNKSHGKVIDSLDAARQMYLDIQDSDVGEMLTDASEKVKTQKVLLVGHSQGNFYANNIYDAVAGQTGGVPFESIGVYGVATPASRVGGSGLYITSDTDKMIEGFASKVSLNSTLLPNAHIEFKPSDGDPLGHGFGKIYLNYLGDRIISEITGTSLAKLRSNNIQDENAPCIIPPKLTFMQKVQGVALAVSDHTLGPVLDGTYDTLNTVGTGVVKGTVATVKFTYNAGVAIGDAGFKAEVAVGNAAYKTSLAVGNTTIKGAKAVGSGISSVAKSFAHAVGGLFHKNTATVIDSAPSEDSPQDTRPREDTSQDNSSSPDNTLSKNLNLPKSLPPGITPSSAPKNIQVLPLSSLPSTLNSTPQSNANQNNVIAVAKSGTSNSTPNLYQDLLPGGGGVGAPSTSSSPPVVPDTIPPVITVNGINPITINIGVNYNDAGADALDDIDGVVSVQNSGTVNTTIVGTYTITYTATDLAGNVSSTTRTVNVVTPPVDTTPPVISILGKNPDLITYNPSLSYSYPDAGATALDAVDGPLTVVTTGHVDASNLLTSVLTYTATDAAGNVATATRNVKVVTWIYIPKYGFGAGNGDGHDWQVWSFAGSNVYDWTDTYVNHYLLEQFKIQAYLLGGNCSQCLERGVFNHDPQQGFEFADRTLSPLEANPQGAHNGITYDVALQWDSGGYTFTIFNNGAIENTGHQDIPNLTNNFWVGWDGSFNGFTNFPAGFFEGIPFSSPNNMTGGNSMILQPYRIYMP